MRRVVEKKNKNWKQHRNSLWRKEWSVVAVAVATHICTIQMFVHMCPLSASSFLLSSLFLLPPSIPLFFPILFESNLWNPNLYYCRCILRDSTAQNLFASIQLALHALMHVALLHTSVVPHYTHTRAFNTEKLILSFPAVVRGVSFRLYVMRQTSYRQMANVTASVSA